MWYVSGADNGHIRVIVTAEDLFIAGFYHWSARCKVLIQHITTQAVADALADGVRWAIEVEDAIPLPGRAREDLSLSPVSYTHLTLPTN